MLIEGIVSGSIIYPNMMANAAKSRCPYSTRDPTPSYLGTSTLRISFATGQQQCGSQVIISLPSEHVSSRARAAGQQGRAEECQPLGCWVAVQGYRNGPYVVPGITRELWEDQNQNSPYLMLDSIMTVMIYLHLPAELVTFTQYVQMLSSRDNAGGGEIWTKPRLNLFPGAPSM